MIYERDEDLCVVMNEKLQSVFVREDEEEMLTEWQSPPVKPDIVSKEIEV